MSTIYNTYLSTIDHLPCDIVRSLWVVQSCNIAASNERQKLHELLEKHPYQDMPQDPARQEVGLQYEELKSAIFAHNREAYAEMAALAKTLEAHRKSLRRDIALLQAAAQYTPASQEEEAQELLRKQLAAHYKSQPLASQVKALQERNLKDLGKVVIKHTPGKHTGMKIILKMPAKHSKLSHKKLSVRSEHKETKRIVIKPPPVAEAPLVESTPLTPIPVNPAEPETFCFCHQPSFGDMIACDNQKCTNGEWFHYKCVGLTKAEAQKYDKHKWYCGAACKAAAEAAMLRKRKRKKSGW